MKSIEGYDIERDEWVQVKIQLQYERAFGSAIALGDRYIYIVGGTSNTDCIEIIDTYSENESIKSELVLLTLNNYTPWFKEIILPTDEEGIICFCNE